ncbi:MAG TPA: hypothetical protein VGM57_06260 [Pseudolabrys sp.]|jgi:hypothetical protein
MSQILRQTPLTSSSSTAATYLIFVALVATLVAAMVGILFVLTVTFPFSLFALLGVSQFFTWVWSGAVLAAPITMILLPATAALGKSRPIVLCFLLPVVGLIGGVFAMRVWSVIQHNAPSVISGLKVVFPMGLPSVDSPGGEIFIWASAVAGLIAGCIFSAAVHEMRK